MNLTPEQLDAARHAVNESRLRGTKLYLYIHHWNGGRHYIHTLWRPLNRVWRERFGEPITPQLRDEITSRYESGQL